MENIFNNLIISTYYFDTYMSFYMKTDLFDYFWYNFYDETFDTLRLDLRNALKTNANEEYIK